MLKHIYDAVKDSELLFDGKQADFMSVFDPVDGDDRNLFTKELINAIAGTISLSFKRHFSKLYSTR